MGRTDPDSAEIAAGMAELRAVRARARGLYWCVGLFSVFVNLLMLTGPLYMLNVYDRVLGSRSVETLVALSGLVAFLYLMMGLLDFARGRVMGRAGARFQAALDRRVFDAVLSARRMGRVPAEATSGPRDLDAVQRTLTSPVLMAVFDLPFAPLFILGIFLFHPWLGLLALTGGGVLILAALINQWVTKHPLALASDASLRAELTGAALRDAAEMIQSLGMREASFTRWAATRTEALRAAMGAGDAAGGFGAGIRAFRLFLQSAMLGLGAYLVLQGDLTPGAMIAGSILLGRALAPVETLVNQWPVIQRGLESWWALARLLGAAPPEVPCTALPRPRARVEASQVSLVPPGEMQAVLRMVSFQVGPGQAIGVIGPSGAGKSSLARVLVGLWPPAGGKIRLDGAALDHYAPDVLGQHVGYLLQRVQLFEGTIKDNISRLAARPDDAAVVAAAQKAAAHDMILRLPEGYDTRIDASGGPLSGGQIQRIGLARAMYGDPVIVVLDEPNSNLDNDGSLALNAAIRALKSEGRAVFVMAHRPTAIQECDLLLCLDGGIARAFGPREAVLQQVVANCDDIRQAQGDSAGLA